MGYSSERSSYGLRANGRSRKELIDRIKEGLAADEPRAVHWLLRTGYIAKGEYRCGDIYGTPPTQGGGSFHYTFSNRKWKDYGSGEPGGIGVFSLYVANQHGDLDKAIDLGADFLKIPEADRPKPRQDKTSAHAKPKAPWFEVDPPANAPAPDFRKVWRQGVFKRSWEYRDQTGRLLFHVPRYESAARKGEKTKKFTPAVTYGHTGDGRLHWAARGGKAILFGLELLASTSLSSDCEVWIFEGEKAATAARDLFPDRICLSWKGGTSNALHIDLAPLAGRRVRLVADRDDDGVGEKAMRVIARRLLEAGALAVVVVTMPETFPDGWDVADRLPKGWTLEDIRARIEAAPWQEPPTPPPPRGTKEGIEPYWPMIARPIGEVRPIMHKTLKASAMSETSLAMRMTPGGGKTWGEIEISRSMKGWTLFLEPTHKIALQVTADMDGFGFHVAGRGYAPDPNKPTETLCVIAEEAEEAHAARINVREELCNHCPFRSGCRYLEQLTRIEEAMAERESGAIVTVHQYYAQSMSREIDADKIARIVIDERIDTDRDTRLPLDRLEAESMDAIHAGEIAAAFDEAGHLDLSRFDASDLEERAEKEELHLRLKLDRDWSFDQRLMAIRRHAAQMRVEFRWRFARLFRVMAQEIRLGRAVSNQVVLIRGEGDPNGGDRRDSIHIYEKRDVAEKLAGKPVHYIDGTMDRLQAGALLGDECPYIALDAERNLHVTQVCDTLFSKNRMLMRKDAAKNRQELYRFILALGARHRTILIGAPLAIRELMEKEWPAFVAGSPAPPTVAWLHMNSGRGVNDYAQFDACVEIGREEPRARTIEALARMRRPDMAITSLPWSPDDPSTGPAWPQRVQGYTMKDGRKLGVEVSFHPDPVCQSVLQQIREGELVQLADRLRAVNRTKAPALYLLTSIPTELPIDRLLPWRELLAEVCGELPWHQLALQAGSGAAPLRAEWLVGHGIFETIAAAEKAVTRLAKAVEAGADNGVTLATFRVVGQRGKDSLAVIAPHVTNPAEILAQHVGELSRFNGEVPTTDPAAFEPEEPIIARACPGHRIALDTVEGMKMLMDALRQPQNAVSYELDAWRRLAPDDPDDPDEPPRWENANAFMVELREVW